MNNKDDRKTKEHIPIKDLYVSMSGSDVYGDGSFEKPYGTIKNAQKAVREEINKGGLRSDVCIYIRGGTYYLSEPIIIGINDFDNKFKVIYTNYKDEIVRIIGGVPLYNWTESDKTGVFETDCPSNSAFYSLYENGKRLIPAREDRWQNKTVNDKSHLQAVYGSATSWFGEVIKVKDLEGDRLELSAEKCDWSGDLQYLQGAREYINECGEWAIEGNKVFLKPYAPDKIDKSEIVAGTSKSIFEIEGTSDILVRNIVVQGLNLEMNAFGENLLAHARRNNVTGEYDENLNGIVSICNAENISVENCYLCNAGYLGVTMKGFCQNNSISGNVITNTGFAGIFLIGENPGSLNYCNRFNTISNNMIKNVGEFVGHGAGIYLMNSGENRIVHNEISDIPRYGISMKGIRYGVFKDNGIDVSFEDHWKYNQTTGNYIGFNKIYNTGTRSGDGGGIEGWGIGRYNHIDNNLIYNAYRGVPTDGWRGHSIFLDDAAHYTKVTNNIVYDESPVAVNAGIFIKSIDNYVENNIFDVSYAKNGAADIAPYICPAGGSVFRNNIVYSCSEGAINSDGSVNKESECDRIMLMFGDDGNSSGTPALESLSEMDNNIYFNSKGKILFMIQGKLLSFEEWKICPENKKHYDANSICEDPLFADAEHHDYRILKGSPAEKRGFIPIKIDLIGLLKGFPFKGLK